MRPPKNPEKQGTVSLATRWTTYECFIDKLPSHLKAMLISGNLRPVHDIVIEMIEGYIAAGELNGVRVGCPAGLITLDRFYEICGDSVDRFEHDNFLNHPEQPQIVQADGLQVVASLDNPGGDFEGVNILTDHEAQEAAFLAEMRRRKIPDFKLVPDGERMSIVRFMQWNYGVSASTGQKIWQRLLGDKVGSAKKTGNYKNKALKDKK